MAPFPLNPDGGVGPGCARHGAGGTPALPGGPPPITIAPSVGSQPNRIDDAQMSTLDDYEGVGYGYRRDEITVSLDGTETKVCVYVAEKNAIDDALMPYCWYYDLVLSGAKQHELPRDYIAGLRAIPFTRDPKANRKTRLEALEALRKYEESKKMA